MAFPNRAGAFSFADGHTELHQWTDPRTAPAFQPGVMAALNRLTYPKVEIPAAQAMKCAEFAAQTIRTREVRQKEESEAAASKRQHKAEMRRQHLASILERADSLWPGIEPLMDQKIASAYDQAAAQLEELRDAYAQAGGIPAFQHKLAEFRSRYSNRPAMLRRIEKL
jgi:hypothetical protein